MLYIYIHLTSEKGRRFSNQHIPKYFFGNSINRNMPNLQTWIWFNIIWSLADYYYRKKGIKRKWPILKRRFISQIFFIVYYYNLLL